MSESTTPWPTPAQRKLAGAAIGLVSFLVIIACFVAIIVILARVVGMFSGVIWPLAVAGILALMLRPLVGLLQNLLHLGRIGSVLLLYGLVIVALGVSGLLIVPALVEQILEFLANLPELRRQAALFLEETYPIWLQRYEELLELTWFQETVASVQELARNLATRLLPNLKSAGGHVLGLFGVAAGLAIIPVYLFFFLQSDRDPTQRLGEFLPFLKEDTKEDIVYLAREFVSIIVAFFRGQLLIGLIMGILLAIGFSLAGLKFGIVLGLFSGFLNVVPYLGTMLGLLTTLPTAYFQPEGSLWLVLFVLLIFTAVQLFESYFLTPKIMGKTTGLHPVTIIIAIFFWGTALGGILGMVLAIPLTAFFVTVWRLAKKKYLRPIDS